MADELGKVVLRAIEENRFYDAQKLLEYYFKFDSNNIKNFEALKLLGRCLENQNKHYGVMAVCRKALAVEPDSAEVYSELAVSYKKTGRFDLSFHYHETAIHLSPDNSKIWYNYAVTLLDAGLYQKAFDTFTKVLELNPDDYSSIFGHSMIYLMHGNYEQGFKLLESRYKAFPWSYEDRNKFIWWEKGVSIEGKSILVLFEQGFGDTLLFSRFIPLIKTVAGAKKVFLISSPQLSKLFTDMENLDVLLETPVRVDKKSCDLQINLMSIPYMLGINSPEELPPPIPLSIPQESRDKIQKFTKLYDKRFKIGIVWTGRANNRINKHRSSPLKNFLRLYEVPGIELFSFHKEYVKEENDDEKRGMRSLVHDLAGNFGDFTDTAAAIEEMDLMITTDSSVVHLAGTLGKPTWLLLHTSPYWVWMEKKKDNPWYPSLRIYRQEKQGDWNPVFDQVISDLVSYVAEHKKY